MAVSSTARPAPFTPKRAPPTPLLLSTHKKYKAPLSSEARTRSATTTATTSSRVPATPTAPRPRTPGTPNRSTNAKSIDSPLLGPATSEMDVSNINPEDNLVDYQSVEPGDISGELDESTLPQHSSSETNNSNPDKVMVSIRIRPTTNPSAWQPTPNTNSLSLAPAHTKSPSDPPPTFTFDAIFPGPTPQPTVYTTTARAHVHAAMAGFNAVIFAYGQTASGKTHTLAGDDADPGIIPRAMRDVFRCIRGSPEREYLLRCAYLEIYNEAVYDLLAPGTGVVQIQGGGGMGEVVLAPLREEVVTSLRGVKEVLKRGEGNRRTACTDWNERSSRSHSVFRMVIESRERGSDEEEREGRQTPGPGNGRQTPGLGGRAQTPGPRLQARGGRSVRVSVLSLIDLAGSEKATSDKERTREGKYINTSLLTLGTVIGTLAENAAKHKSDHIPYRNSKLTRLLQPSLAGNARISVICTINPDAGAVTESLSTLGFARRVRGVQLNAQKKEIMDTDALIERYRKEIEDLKQRLAEREKEAPVRNRRLSAREQVDESQAMKDLNARIQQLTKLILTSQTVGVDSEPGVGKGENGESRPGSPVKIDFDMSPYQLQQELLNAKIQIETQGRQILSLEAALEDARKVVDSGSSEPVGVGAAPDVDVTEVESSSATVSDSEGESVGEKLAVAEGEVARRVTEEMEKEWRQKVEAEVKKREESERWAEEVVKQLDKEKKMRKTLEDERRALKAFVSMFDSLGLGAGADTSATTSSSSSMTVSKLKKPMAGGAAAAFAGRRAATKTGLSDVGGVLPTLVEAESPVRVGVSKGSVGGAEESPLRLELTGGSAMRFMGGEEGGGQIMHEQMPEEAWSDVSFGQRDDDEGEEVVGMLLPKVNEAMVSVVVGEKEKEKAGDGKGALFGIGEAVPGRKGAQSPTPTRVVLADKENVAPVVRV